MLFRELGSLVLSHAACKATARQRQAHILSLALRRAAKACLALSPRLLAQKKFFLLFSPQTPSHSTFVIRCADN